jgi:hypothetical protein
LPVAVHIGKRFDELLTDVAERIAPQLDDVLRSGEPLVDGEVLARTSARAGEQRWYRHSYYADKNAEGAVVGICGERHQMPFRRAGASRTLRSNCSVSLSWTR